jgi:hypothetical protein
MKIQITEIPNLNSKAPIFSYCRHLIKKGIHPRTKLEVYREDTLALSIKTINKGAKLSVKEDNQDGPYFIKYRPFSPGGV